MDNLITKQHLLFLAIGAFTVLLTAEIAYFVGQITNQILIITNQKPLVIIIGKEVSQLTVYIFTVFIILKLILKQKGLNQNNLKNKIIWLIVIYITIQILQILYGAYGISSFENYMESAMNYSEYIKENYLILIVSSIVYYIQLILFAIITLNYTIKDD